MGLDSPVTPVARFQIPDVLRNWPWHRALNQHYLECKAASASWFEEFKALSPDAQASFNRCDFNLLAALGYPLQSKAELRVACDLMNLGFLNDAELDLTDEKGARRQADAIMGAIRDPRVPRPDGEWVGGEVARQFWLNAITESTQSCQRRFLHSFQRYLDAAVQRAKDRDHSYIRSIQSYLDVRRETICSKPLFALLEMEMDLPDAVFYSPAIVQLTALCTDMMIVGNDLYSYNVEQARGTDGHNIVTLAMHELQTDLNGALAWISKYHDDIVAQFMQVFNNLPSWGEPLDAQVARYVDGLGNWVRAVESWSFESQRYFGTEGLQIQKTRLVDLSPRQVSGLDGHGH